VVLAWSLSWSVRYRVQAIWVAGGLSVYAASLLILEAMQRISNQDTSKRTFSVGTRP
jgi:hypothetical protein